MDEFTPYEIALLCGGSARVAQCALLALHEQRRVRVSRGTHRVTVVEREPGDAIQAALLEEIPDSGFQLRFVLAAVSESAEVSDVADGLIGRGLLRRRFRGRLWRTRRGRAARRRLRADAEAGTSGGLGELGKGSASNAIAKLAALGTGGIADTKLREVLESDAPEMVELPRFRFPGHRNLDASNLPDDKYSGGSYGGYGGY
ncbi:TIGR04222 domain-containing membrane protein [Actinomadura darangshiensis]|uniref:TIGR04222 domain-containing membrane protein n=1 Tax=Actinomadura darangshiensis TaxID=705336 RepID=A0A4R5AQM9_9ACTN|nr:TIGR04222 domain-containing membrane protein [Actinomadura darangshiensis]TDD74495.1 TIGR04222 domain-containing membrane protein [Actinomadura darangshiensis]